MLKDTLPPSPLQQAADIVGNLNQLAKKIGKRQSTVWNWLKKGRVPADWCPKIEEATDGKVPRHVLRPDIFPAGVTEPAVTAYQVLLHAERVVNAGVPDDSPAIDAFHVASERFIEAPVTSMRGVLLKLQRIDTVEGLDGHLDHTPNLMWPRMLKALIRDLQAIAGHAGRRIA